MEHRFNPLLAAEPDSPENFGGLMGGSLAPAATAGRTVPADVSLESMSCKPRFINQQSDLCHRRSNIGRRATIDGSVLVGLGLTASS